MKAAIVRRCALSVGVIVGILLTAGWAAAQSDAQQPAGAATALQGTFPVVLAKSLDSKKLKPGDEVVAETMGPLQDQSGKEIPRGSKVIGHVTQAQARSKGDAQSSLAVVFDKIEISKGGGVIPIKGVLQAVAPGASNAGSQPGFPPSLGPGSGPGTAGTPNIGAGPGGGFPGGTLGRSGGAPGNAPPGSEPQQGPNPGSSAPTLSTASKGVVGFHNLEMDSNSVLTTSGKQVKLDSGTQMMVRAE